MARRTRLICYAIAPILLLPVIAVAEEQTDQSVLIMPRLERGAMVNHAEPASPFDLHIAEASARFGLPDRWIHAVIAAESAGDPRAVSSAGAMGLMQIMPATWAELRVAHRLGNDPFAPRDNILGGAAYLRELYDRFGIGGFLAAYNAGPGRYAEHLATGRPLPRETRTYVARLAPAIDGSHTVERPRADGPIARDWRDAAIFTGRVSAGAHARLVPIDPRPTHHSEHAVSQSEEAHGTLFVPARSVPKP